MTNLSELREKAERATKGTWEVYEGCSWRRIGVSEPRHDDCAVLFPTFASDGHPELSSRDGNRDENLAYIVAAQPQVVIGMIDELEAKDRRIAALEKALEPFVEILNVSESSALKDGRNPDDVPDTLDVLAFRNVPGLKLGSFRLARSTLTGEKK